MADSTETDLDAEADIVHRTLETNGSAPAIQIAEAVADLEETEPTELPTLYDCIDGMLSDLFSDPPAPEAQMTVEFSYAGYRITVEQDGTVKFVKPA